MASFAMCAECAREYSDPADRRFHAQPVCCPNCGPALRYRDGDGGTTDGDGALLRARLLLRDGGIIGTLGALRIYLSGAEANAVAGLLGATVVSNASALKMAYAAWTKGTAALILAIRDLAEAEGVGDALRDEWLLSQPQLFDR